MKSTHTYILEPYRTSASRHTCPDCGSPRQFTRYINTETNEYLADHVGRCNREQNCAYHYTPKQYFQDNQGIYPLSLLQREGAGGEFFKPKFSHPKSDIPHPTSFIPDSILQNSLSNYKHNHFITFLKSIFEPTTITHLINTYFIGTSKNWPGSTVFWQIDTHGNIRDGKIMLYNPTTGRRVKQPYNHITWAHSALKLKDYNLQQCFFGEHLLKLHPNKPVSIVESEKTAIIATVYFPQFIWLATGGKHGCKWSSNSVSNVLTGRHITLWPDIKAYDDWQTKASELSKSGLQASVSNLLEQVSTNSEKEAGLDIADYLIRFKPNQFSDNSVNDNITINIHQQASCSIPNIELSESCPPFFSKGGTQRGISFMTASETNQNCDDWDLDTLESFFNSIQLPSTPIRLNQCSLILDVPKFIFGHLSVLHTYNGNKVFLHYLQRLQLLQQILISTNLDLNSSS